MTPTLPAELRASLAGARGRGLLVTRNNLALAHALSKACPGVDWTILSKEQARGWSMLDLARLLVSRRWAAVVIEDSHAEIRRRPDVYRSMALLARTGSRWLLLTGEDGSTTEARRVRFREWGSLGVGLVAEAWATVGGLISARLLDRRLDRPVPGRGTAGTERSNRVAVLRTSFWFGTRAGGSISHAQGVIQGMMDLGLAPRLWTTSPIPLPARVEQIEVPPRRRPMIVEEAAVAAFNRRFLDRVEAEARAFGPGVVYHRHDALSLAGLALARRLGVPLVLEVNSSEVWVRLAWSRLHFEGLARSMERTAFRRADRLVLVSEELVPTVLELGGDRDRIVVNPNGVDVDRFRPGDDGGAVRRALSLEPDAVVCGFLGTFTRWHGVLFLAGQIPGLVERDPRLHFLFLGDGDLQPRVRLELEEAGVSSSATFTGLLDPDRVPGYLAACDILLSPHLPFEDGTPFFGSPTKLFEYMAAGRPVVASRLGQIGRVVEDGDTGLLYPPGDGDAFGRALLALAGDPEGRRRMGKAARQRAERRYTWRANVRRALEGLVDLPEA